MQQIMVDVSWKLPFVAVSSVLPVNVWKGVSVQGEEETASLVEMSQGIRATNRSSISRLESEK